MESTHEPEAVFEMVPTTRTPGMLWPIGLVVTVGVLVAVSLASPQAPADSAFAADVGSVVGATPPTSRAAGMPEPRSKLVVFIPEAGQVILGSSIPVAGRIGPLGRPPRSAVAGAVRVVILDGERVLGAGDISIVNGVFVGCITVDVPPTKGRAVRISLAVANRPADPPSEVPFVLGAESSTQTGIGCASGSMPGRPSRFCA